MRPTVKPAEELTTEAKALAKRLGSRKSQVRHEAEQQIEEMGTAGRDVLVSIMRHEEQRRRSGAEQMYIHLAIYPGLFGIPAICIFLRNHTLGPYLA